MRKQNNIRFKINVLYQCSGTFFRDKVKCSGRFFWNIFLGQNQMFRKIFLEYFKETFFGTKIKCSGTFFRYKSNVPGYCSGTFFQNIFLEYFSEILRGILFKKKLCNILFCAKYLDSFLKIKKSKTKNKK